MDDIRKIVFVESSYLKEHTEINFFFTSARKKASCIFNGYILFSSPNNFILFVKKKKMELFVKNVNSIFSIRRRCAIRNFPFPVSNVCFFPLAYFEGRCLPLKLQNLNVKAIQRMANERIIKMGGRVWYCCLQAFLRFLFFFFFFFWLVHVGIQKKRWIRIGNMRKIA